MASGYERRIGRYGGALAREFLSACGISARDRVLDVGCGAGALTVPLAELVGAPRVAAIDPDPAAAAACRARVPGADVRVGYAEELPFEDSSFDAVLAQLVVGLLDDAVAGVREMRRVARPGGLVATCVWDFGGGMTMLRAFWDAAAAVSPRAREHDQARTRPYSDLPELQGLLRAAGLEEVRGGALSARAAYEDFDDLWEPLLVPDGAPGRFLETLSAAERAAVRERLWSELGRPDGRFELDARAWWAAGRA